MKYHISDVLVRKIKGEKGSKRVLSMQMKYEFQGMSLDSYTSGSMYTTLSYDKTGVPSCFSRNSIFSLSSAEPVDKVIDFKSAVRIVEGRRAQFGSFRISKIVPLYALYFEEASEQGAKIEARPVYAFFFERADDGNERGWRDEGSINIDNYIYVDMVTEDVSMG